VASPLLRGASPFDPALRAGEAEAPRVEAHRDGIGASVSVVSYPGGEKTLRIDGFEAASNKAMAGYMPMMTHIPMLLHPDPRRLLVVCFGTGATAGAGILYPEARVDAVDINRNVFGFASHFSTVNHNVARHPRARLVVDDGRNFLLATDERYDVITSEPMPPYHAGVVNLYSKEYYGLARDRLTPGGFVPSTSRGRSSGPSRTCFRRRRSGSTAIPASSWRAVTSPSRSTSLGSLARLRRGRCATSSRSWWEPRSTSPGCTPWDRTRSEPRRPRCAR
jgi:spermidine synthase